MKKIKMILILSIILSSIVKAQNSPSQSMIQEVEPKDDSFIEFMNNVMYENSKCGYLQINPEYYFNVGFKTNDRGDTLIIVQSVMHDPTGYHETLKPNVVIIHNGIRFFIRYTNQYEKEIVIKKFNLKESYYPWTGSTNTYPLKMRNESTGLDGLYIEAKITRKSINVIKLVNCE